MREFHYVRTLGDDGGVDACAGPAVGVDLETVLAKGLPPWPIALELITAVCEILDIADEDQWVHGDVDPRYLFLDEEGALSLEGFGTKRASPVPRADLDQTSTDAYGLGRTALRILSAEALVWPLPDSPEAHDDAVLDAVLAVDLDGLPEAMQGDVQWFIAKLLSHDPDERPSALDTWRTFVAFAAALRPGSGLGAWAAEAVEGSGARRTAPDGQAPSDAEVLADPRRADGPLSQRLAIPTGSGGTAFWNKDAMREAVHGAGVPEADRPPQGIGGGSATDFWKPEELAAMADGRDDAPRPRRARGEGERRARSEAFRRQLQMRAVPDGIVPPSESPEPPRPAPSPPPAESSAVVVRPVTSSVVLAEDRSRGNTLLLALLGTGAIGVLALLLLVAIVAVVSAVVLWTQTGGGTARIPVGPGPEPAPIAIPAPMPDAEPEPVPVVEPEPEPEPAVVPVPPPAPVAMPAPPPPVAKPPPTPPEVAPVPAPAESPAEDARIRLTSSSRGTVSQCATRRVSFSGFRSFEVEAYRLPVTCLVRIDDAVGTFTVRGSGEITCDVADGAVVCDKVEVP